MADVTDPLLADHTGIDRADGLDAASRLQVGVFTRQCAGMRVLPAAAKQARRAGDGLVLTAPGALVLRMLDLTGSRTGLLVDPTVEKAAGGSIAPASRAACPETGRAGYRGRAAHCQARTPAGRRAALAPTSSPSRLTGGRMARDRADRRLPGPAWLQGTR
jgi:hypothetical protein